MKAKIEAVKKLMGIAKTMEQEDAKNFKNKKKSGEKEEAHCE